MAKTHRETTIVGGMPARFAALPIETINGKNMIDQHSTDGECALNADHRAWTRFPPDCPEVLVLVDGQPMTGLIVDESFGGVGIELDASDGANLQIGDTVVVFQKDYPTPGTVQWLQHDSEIHRMRAGIRWSS